VVSVGYLGLIDDADAAKSRSRKYAAGRWFEVAGLPALAYDHAVIADYALRRLKSKLEYTNVACNLLPPTFTFAELEELYATVLERPLDRRNFRRRVLAMGLLKRLREQRRGAHRPAALYAFRHRSVQAIEML
jgi:8-oxo-dGTP diphosphatase